MDVRLARRMAEVRPSAIRELLRLGADPELISFGGGYPDPSLFPMAELREVFDGLLSGGNAGVLQYTVSDGLPWLRGQVAARMARDGTACATEDVLILQGAQQGLDLAAKLVLDPGDVVITENPTFLGALIAFNPCEPVYAPVRTDEDGMDVDDLERVLERTPGARLLYTMPDFQNPTGVTLAARAAAAARGAGEPVRHPGRRGHAVPGPPLRGRDPPVAQEPRHRGPGRLPRELLEDAGARDAAGWAVASAEIIAKLGLLKLAADTQCSTLNMAAASAYLDRFDLDEHIGRIRPPTGASAISCSASSRSSFPPASPGPVRRAGCSPG